MSLNLKRVIDVNFALRAGLDAAVDSHQPSSNPAGRLRNTACSCSAERRRACSRTSAGISDAAHRPGAGLGTGCTQLRHVKRPPGFTPPRVASQPVGSRRSTGAKALTGRGLGGVAGRFSLRGGGVFFSDFMADYARLSAANIARVIAGHLQCTQQPVTPAVTVAPSFPRRLMRYISAALDASRGARARKAGRAERRPSGSCC